MTTARTTEVVAVTKIKHTHNCKKRRFPRDWRFCCAEFENLTKQIYMNSYPQLFDAYQQVINK